MNNLFSKPADINYVQEKDKQIEQKIADLKNSENNSGIGAVLQLKTNMQAGVLTYVLPRIPPQNSVMAFMNGLEVSCTLNGAELTITDYSANEIESTDLLTVFY